MKNLSHEELSVARDILRDVYNNYLDHKDTEKIELFKNYAKVWQVNIDTLD